MIKTVAEFLAELVTHTKPTLDSQNITHPTCIGDMYEGLTIEILNRVIPPNLNLMVTKGFVVDNFGNSSGQIDCMLVQGEGQQFRIPPHYKWDIFNVIAVFEVKKSLSKGNLIDAFEHFKHLGDLAQNYLDHPQSEDIVFSIKNAQKTFEETTGIKAPNYTNIEQFSMEHQGLFHALTLDNIIPLRIILSYDGYQTERGLRQALRSYIETCIGKKGYGPVKFPNLIISNQFSLAKATGQPYSAPIYNNKWYFFNSCRANPFLLLLEMIWTKLEQLYPIGGFWEDDIQDEPMSPYLAAKTVKYGSENAWVYEFVELSENEPKDKGDQSLWEPYFLTLEQATTLQLINIHGFKDITDIEFLKWCHKNNLESLEFINSLLETRLVVQDKNLLISRTEQLCILTLPSGDFVASNDQNRLMSWYELQLTNNQSQNKP